MLWIVLGLDSRRLDPLFIFLVASGSIKIPQHGLYRPNIPFFHTACLAFHNGNKVLRESHANVRADSCENMPPAMQLEQKSPGESDVVLELGDIAAQVEVDVPEEVAKEEAGWLWSAKS